MESQVYTKKRLIFGCGNTLFGDDGFGPKVIEALNSNHTLPENTLALDAGTAVRDFIFDLILVDDKPEIVWIIDAVTMEDRSNGEVFEIDLSCVPAEKMADFSLHQSPTSNLLFQLRQADIEVKMLGMHTPAIPNEIQPGLSDFAKDAIPVACDWIIQELKSRGCF